MHKCLLSVREAQMHNAFSGLAIHCFFFPSFFSRRCSSTLSRARCVCWQCGHGVMPNILSEATMSKGKHLGGDRAGGNHFEGGPCPRIAMPH